MKGFMIFGLAAWLVAGLAYGQIPVPDQPISNLQNGISPFAAAARAQQEQRRAAAIQQQHQADDRLYAVRARIAAHDCEGARTLALQGGDFLMAQQAGALCKPSTPLTAGASVSPSPSMMELGPVIDPDAASSPSHSLSTKRSRQLLKSTSHKSKHRSPPSKASSTTRP